MQFSRILVLAEEVRKLQEEALKLRGRSSHSDTLVPTGQELAKLLVASEHESRYVLIFQQYWAKPHHWAHRRPDEVWPVCLSNLFFELRLQARKEPKTA